MGVRVNKAGGDNQIGCVNNAGGVLIECSGWRNFGDPALRHPNIGPIAGRTRAIHNGSVCDQQIVGHACPLYPAQLRSPLSQQLVHGPLHHRSFEKVGIGPRP